MNSHADSECWDVLIVGAGPAGLMAAIIAAEAGASVAVCEHQDRPGVKLLSTGGGRCNITTSLDGPDLYEQFGRQGRFIAPAMDRLGPEALRDWFAKAGVPTYCDDQGCVFPRSNSARDVLDALLKRCRKAGAELLTRTAVTGLWLKEGTLRGLHTARSGDLTAKSVIIAAGGVSYPQLGATGDGYDLAKAGGHDIVAPLPALVGLTLADRRLTRCAGVSTEAEVCLEIAGKRRAKASGDILITHAGISGPAVLNLSGEIAAAMDRGKSAALRVNLTPGASANQWQQRFAAWRRSAGKKLLRNLLSDSMTKSLVSVLLDVSGIDQAAQMAHTPADGLDRLARNLTDLTLEISGTEGLAKAMVTRGGVSLKKVDPHTMGSRCTQGLYFAGEVLDLDGPCGGFNLQWAMASGALAGESAARGA